MTSAVPTCTVDSVRLSLNNNAIRSRLHGDSKPAMRLGRRSVAAPRRQDTQIGQVSGGHSIDAMHDRNRFSKLANKIIQNS